MALCDGLPALLAGDAVVAKPVRRPCCPRCWPSSCSAQPLPTDLWQVVAGPGPEFGPEIVGRASICFTGSTATGS